MDESTEICQICGGTGVFEVEIITPTCCGKCSPNGDCYSDCAVPMIIFDHEQCSCQAITDTTGDKNDYTRGI